MNPQTALKWVTVYKCSISKELKLTVSTGCVANEVKFINTDLRVFFQGNLASRRGISFKMEELEQLAKMETVQNSFFHEQNGRSLQIKQTLEGYHTVCMQRPGSGRQSLRLRKGELALLVAKIPACIFIMKNYGRRAEVLAPQLAGSLNKILSDAGVYSNPLASTRSGMAFDSLESELKFRMARVALALGIGKNHLECIPEDVEPNFTFFAISENEMINY